MRTTAPTKVKSRDTDPEFRRLSRADDVGRAWSRRPPKGLSLDLLPLYGRTLDPQVIEQVPRAKLEKLCEFKGRKAVVEVPPHSGRKNLKGFVVYTLGPCSQALEVISKSPAKRRAEAEARAQKAAQTSQDILRALEALREAQDAPDFTRRPTDEAYKAVNESLTAAYTHYVGSAPAPALAPDGDGGVVVQWKSGKREVSLVVPPSGVEKSYIFSRGDKTAKIDYDISGFVLARQLRSTFAE
jgi:hypothetical protein